MATLQTQRIKQGGEKSDAVLAATADTATLAATLGGDAVLVAFDPAKVPDEVALQRWLALIMQRIGEAAAFPPA